MRFKYSFAILNSGIYTGGESLKQVSGLQVHFGESLFLRSCLEGSDNGVVGLEVFLQKGMGPTASGENPFPGSPSGSPTGGATGAADMAQRLLAAVEAATIVAQAAAQIAQNVRQGSDEKTWWKLRPKPPTFDHASRESEIAGWKEWSWSFEQYMGSIDTRFSDDIQEMRKDITKAIDPVDFSDSERQRNSFMYSMLSSLLRQRPLLVVRQITGSNGLEA